MKDISIVYGQSATGEPSKPIALVNPPPQYVEMTSEVAAMRGIRCRVGAESWTLQEQVRRNRKVHEDERQVAQISIAHDGDYAVATCMAAAELLKDVKGPDTIIDDGSGEPLHEPEWTDTGFPEGEELDICGLDNT